VVKGLVLMGPAKTRVILLPLVLVAPANLIINVVTAMLHVRRDVAGTMQVGLLINGVEIHKLMPVFIPRGFSAHVVLPILPVTNAPIPLSPHAET